MTPISNMALPDEVREAMHATRDDDYKTQFRAALQAMLDCGMAEFIPHFISKGMRGPAIAIRLDADERKREETL